MIPLSALADPSDWLGACALLMLAVLFGALPARLALPVFSRKRQEVAILFGLAALRRAAAAGHLDLVEVVLQVVTATAAVLSMVVTARSLAREARRARRA